MVIMMVMLTYVRSPSGEVKFHRELLQVGMSMSRDLFDRGAGLERGAGLDPALSFTDGTCFVLIGQLEKGAGLDPVVFFTDGTCSILI